MDTTSNALSRILHLLTEHQDVQDRLRQELVDAQREHGELQHDELVNLPFLDAICRETMRLCVLCDSGMSMTPKKLMRPSQIPTSSDVT